MEVRLFGELEAVQGEVAVPVRGAKQRALLALLVLHRGEPVSADRLIDVLWGDGQAANPGNALQAQIGQLRRTLGADAVRSAPEDKTLSDDEWAQIAGDIMHRTGLAPRGQDDDAVRWVAVRHGGDHIHIVAMLARQDGGKPRLSNERHRVREACRAAEERHGLRRTAPGDRTAAPRPTRAENEKPRRRSWEEPPRVTLKRAVSTAAAAAASEQEFFTRLADAGVLVRQRFSTRNPGEITGYSVALPADTTRAGTPVWFGGGKLAPRPDRAQAPLPLATRPRHARRAVHPSRTQRHLGSTPPVPGRLTAPARCPSRGPRPRPGRRGRFPGRFRARCATSRRTPAGRRTCAAAGSG